ncbi:dihydrolipoyl dehydrogenase [Clostridium sp. DL1XJH146]
MRKKVAVIGGGPGGYVAAIRAAQLGAEVTVFEKEHIGGTCLNVGCIPTKVLLHTSELFEEFNLAKEYGIEVEGEVKVNWQVLQARKKKIVDKLVGGIKGLLKANKVKIVLGEASLKNKNNIDVILADGKKESYEADSIIIATGSVSFIPPIPGAKLDGVIDSTGALSLEEIPEELVIIGGGVIGLEFATLYNSLGSTVTVIEMLPTILPMIDREISDSIRKTLVKKGVTILNNAKVNEINEDNNKLVTKYTLEGKEILVNSDKVLVSVGRRAVTSNINLEEVGVNTNRGFISIDDNMETNVKGIYAIGDCTGKIMLAHVASEQGVVAAENIMGHESKLLYNTVPSCVYTKPEIASVGLTEEQVKEKGINYKVGKFPLQANGKSLIMNETEGCMIKIISDSKYDEVLGVHMIGPRATDLITEGALAIRLEATVDELITTVHAHPTVGEAMKEAALAVNKQAIHIPNK